MKGKTVVVTLNPTGEEYKGILEVDTPSYVELSCVGDRTSSLRGTVIADRMRFYTSSGNVRHIREKL